MSQTALLIESIERKSVKVHDPAARMVRVLKEQDSLALPQQYGIHVSQIYVRLLEMGIFPYRYLRNRESISLHEQLKLAKSKVSIIGAGGLGGSVILILARIGLGHLVIIDHDVFDETNLNRQAISSSSNLRVSKCQEAEKLVKHMNPDIVVTSHREK